MKKRLLLLTTIAIVFCITACKAEPEIIDGIEPPVEIEAALEVKTDAEIAEFEDIKLPEEAEDVSLLENSTLPSATDPLLALLTYDEAMAIAKTWLDNHADLPTSYTIHDLSYPPDEIPPPTYSLFGIQYYEFIMSSHWDETYSNGYLHYVLVHAETGELLSRYCDFYLGTDGKHLSDVFVKSLDDWYTDKHAAYTPAFLTADEAIAIYDAWKNERYGDNPDRSNFNLHSKSYGKYEIFGEQYYYFRAEDDDKYWYNILVHMETGELLHVTIYDGMFGGEDVMTLADYYTQYLLDEMQLP